MKDRIPLYPSRRLITPENGSAPYYATITRADEPTEEGTPLNKITLLSDETAELFRFTDETATVNNALSKLQSTTQQTITYHVSYSAGDDANTGLDQTAPCKTIQRAIDQLPKTLNDDIFIEVAPSTAYPPVEIIGFGGAGSITVVGMSGGSASYQINSSPSHVGAVRVENVTLPFVSIKNCTLKAITGLPGNTHCLSARRAFHVVLAGCQIIGGSDTQRATFGVRAEISNVQVIDCHANYLVYGMGAVVLGWINISNTTLTGTYSLFARGGFISRYGGTISGTTVADQGGAIFGT